MPVHSLRGQHRERERGRKGRTLEGLAVLRAVAAGIALFGKDGVKDELAGRALGAEHGVDEGEALEHVGLLLGGIGEAAQAAEQDALIVRVHHLVALVTVQAAGAQVGDVEAVGIEAGAVRHVGGTQPLVGADGVPQVRLVAGGLRVVQVHGDAGRDVQLVGDGVFVRLQPLSRSARGEDGGGMGKYRRPDHAALAQLLVPAAMGNLVEVEGASGKHGLPLAACPRVGRQHGGAVVDHLHGLEPVEHDWRPVSQSVPRAVVNRAVVGGAPQRMSS